MLLRVRRARNQRPEISAGRTFNELTHFKLSARPLTPSLSKHLRELRLLQKQRAEFRGRTRAGAAPGGHAQVEGPADTRRCSARRTRSLFTAMQPERLSQRLRPQPPPHAPCVTARQSHRGRRGLPKSPQEAFAPREGGDPGGSSRKPALQRGPGWGPRWAPGGCRFPRASDPSRGWRSR